MRLALISDLHANAEALHALTDVLATVDAVACLGDLVGYYCQVNEVIDTIRGINARCVLGNHDYFLLHGCPPNLPVAVQWGIAYARRTITAANRAWLASLPLIWGGEIAGCSILCAHGSPWRPLTDYLYADSPSLVHLNGFDFTIIALGQTHRALIYREEHAYVLNPGSVGQSRDRTAHACAMLLDTETLTVEQIARLYDPVPVIVRAQEQGAGAWVTKHLV